MRPPRGFILGLCLLALPLLTPWASSAQSSTFTAAADATIRAGNPNKNLGSDSTLRVRGGGQNRALLGFDAAAIASALEGAHLASARLELYIDQNSHGWGRSGRSLDLYRLLTAWTERGVTWNCPADFQPTNSRPDCAQTWAGGDYDPEPTDSLLVDDDLEGWVSFDVTADIAALLTGQPFEGWLLRHEDEEQGGTIDFASRNGVASRAPRLVILAESPTADPVPPRLAIDAPAEGYLVNQSSPTLLFSYSDGGSGIDPGTFSAQLNGLPLAGCTVGSQAASCPTASLAEGLYTLSASVADHAGNRANASRSFNLLLGPGLRSASFPATADSSLRRSQKNRNFGAEPRLELSGGGPSRALLRFDATQVAAVLANATLRSARVEITLERNRRGWGRNGRLVGLHRLTADWSESQVTWSCPRDTNLNNNQADCPAPWNGGSFIAAPTASVLHTSQLVGLIGFDVTADVAALAAGEPNYGWLLKKADDGRGGAAEYASREGTA
ncbi:MAG TPA: DNRLRE domain-containing protein, partial [Thermoanaerobaculia bacterium]|nr:DNRLRE domain-containing protein [Thermoanaerobaculia bacterium]